MQVHGHSSSSRKAICLAKESMQVYVHLPEEIIYNILLRIPAEFLITLKAVCKLWFDIISDRKFVNAHLSHHQSDFHYVVVSERKSSVHRDYELINLNDMEDTKFQLQDQQLKNFLKDKIEFESSYGGLLLFKSLTREQLYVCNPVTRKCSVLPTPCSDFQEVTEGKFRETQVPFLPRCQNHILELNGSICITDYCPDNNRLDIWTLQNWEKCMWSKSSIIVPRILPFHWYTKVSIFHYSNQTKIVTCKDNKMVFTYDFKNSEWKNFTYSVKDGVYVWFHSAHINSLAKFE